MSLISIAQRETFYISFLQFANKGQRADLLTSESCRMNCSIAEDHTDKLTCADIAQTGKYGCTSHKNMPSDSEKARKYNGLTVAQQTK